MLLKTKKVILCYLMNMYFIMINANRNKDFVFIVEYSFR